MSTAEFQVTGMTCGHCEMAVREEVSQVPDVADLQVSATSGRLVVTGANPAESVDEARVLAAVAEAGYSAVRIR